MKSFKLKSLFEALLLGFLGLLVSCIPGQQAEVKVQNAEKYYGNLIISANHPFEVGEFALDTPGFAYEITFKNDGEHPLTQFNVVLKNTGEVTGVDYKTDGLFSVYPGDGGTCGSKLAPGQECTVVVTFAPEGSGNLKYDFNVSYKNLIEAETTSFSITALTGLPAKLFIENTEAIIDLGLQEVEDPFLPFFSVAVPEADADPKFESILLKNIGELSAHGLKFTPNSAGYDTAFTIAENKCPAFLPAGESCEVVVAYNPTNNTPFVEANLTTIFDIEFKMDQLGRTDRRQQTYKAFSTQIRAKFDASSTTKNQTFKDPVTASSDITAGKESKIKLGVSNKGFSDGKIDKVFVGFKDQLVVDENIIIPTDDINTKMSKLDGADRLVVCERNPLDAPGEATLSCYDGGFFFVPHPQDGEWSRGNFSIKKSDMEAANLLDGHTCADLSASFHYCLKDSPDKTPLHNDFFPYEIVDLDGCLHADRDVKGLNIALYGNETCFFDVHFKPGINANLKADGAHAEIRDFPNMPFFVEYDSRWKKTVNTHIYKTDILYYLNARSVSFGEIALDEISYLSEKIVLPEGSGVDISEKRISGNFTFTNGSNEVLVTGIDPLIALKSNQNIRPEPYLNKYKVIAVTATTITLDTPFTDSTINSPGLEVFDGLNDNFSETFSALFTFTNGSNVINVSGTDPTEYVFIGDEVLPAPYTKNYKISSVLADRLILSENFTDTSATVSDIISFDRSRIYYEVDLGRIAMVQEGKSLPYHFKIKMKNTGKTQATNVKLYSIIEDSDGDEVKIELPGPGLPSLNQNCGFTPYFEKISHNCINGTNAEEGTVIEPLGRTCDINFDFTPIMGNKLIQQSCLYDISKDSSKYDDRPDGVEKDDYIITARNNSKKFIIEYHDGSGRTDADDNLIMREIEFHFKASLVSKGKIRMRNIETASTTAGGTFTSTLDFGQVPNGLTVYRHIMFENIGSGSIPYIYVDPSHPLEYDKDAPFSYKNIVQLVRSKAPTAGPEYHVDRKSHPVFDLGETVTVGNDTFDKYIDCYDLIRNKPNVYGPREDVEDPLDTTVDDGTPEFNYYSVAATTNLNLQPGQSCMLSFRYKAPYGHKETRTDHGQQNSIGLSDFTDDPSVKNYDMEEFLVGYATGNWDASANENSCRGSLDMLSPRHVGVGHHTNPISFYYYDGDLDKPKPMPDGHPTLGNRLSFLSDLPPSSRTIAFDNKTKGNRYFYPSFQSQLLPANSLIRSSGSTIEADTETNIEEDLVIKPVYYNKKTTASQSHVDPEIQSFFLSKETDIMNKITTVDPTKSDEYNDYDFVVYLGSFTNQGSDRVKLVEFTKDKNLTLKDITFTYPDPSDKAITFVEDNNFEAALDIFDTTDPAKLVVKKDLTTFNDPDDLVDEMEKFVMLIKKNTTGASAIHLIEAEVRYMSGNFMYTGRNGEYCAESEEVTKGYKGKGIDTDNIDDGYLLLDGSHEPLFEEVEFKKKILFIARTLPVAETPAPTVTIHPFEVCPNSETGVIEIDHPFLDTDDANCDSLENISSIPITTGKIFHKSVYQQTYGVTDVAEDSYYKKYYIEIKNNKSVPIKNMEVYLTKTYGILGPPVTEQNSKPLGDEFEFNTKDYNFIFVDEDDAGYTCDDLAGASTPFQLSQNERCLISVVYKPDNYEPNPLSRTVNISYELDDGSRMYEQFELKFQSLPTVELEIEAKSFLASYLDEFTVNDDSPIFTNTNRLGQTFNDGVDYFQFQDLGGNEYSIVLNDSAELMITNDADKDFKSTEIDSFSFTTGQVLKSASGDESATIVEADGRYLILNKTSTTLTAGSKMYLYADATDATNNIRSTLLDVDDTPQEVVIKLPGATQNLWNNNNAASDVAQLGLVLPKYLKDLHNVLPGPLPYYLHTAKYEEFPDLGKPTMDQLFEIKFKNPQPLGGMSAKVLDIPPYLKHIFEKRKKQRIYVSNSHPPVLYPGVESCDDFETTGLRPGDECVMTVGYRTDETFVDASDSQNVAGHEGLYMEYCANFINNNLIDECPTRKIYFSIVGDVDSPPFSVTGFDPPGENTNYNQTYSIPKTSITGGSEVSAWVQFSFNEFEIDTDWVESIDDYEIKVGAVRTLQLSSLIDSGLASKTNGVITVKINGLVPGAKYNVTITPWVISKALGGNPYPAKPFHAWPTEANTTQILAPDTDMTIDYDNRITYIIESDLTGPIQAAENCAGTTIKLGSSFPTLKLTSETELQAVKDFENDPDLDFLGFWVETDAIVEDISSDPDETKCLFPNLGILENSDNDAPLHKIIGPIETSFPGTSGDGNWSSENCGAESWVSDLIFTGGASSLAGGYYSCVMDLKDSKYSVYFE
ncbi:MAG: hypothetical protein ACPGJV_08955 [Bacteriovoracaceae bacterium]